MSHDVYEGRVAVAAQEKYGVVVQHGTQRRSDAVGSPACTQAIKAGKWGKLKIAYGYCCKPRNGHRVHDKVQATRRRTSTGICGKARR